ncbi:MAG: hypothetical protein EZS28_025801 [Streblomastix strix]|uniref:Uncharacterized protein n=1 Tax=Streblomastix strix TaxID=222440 RepID=A0A5J4V826_9EUKA|nr:MAG: hypothetical protein EZS28_025801 [Streblomastix strix]
MKILHFYGRYIFFTEIQLPTQTSLDAPDLVAHQQQQFQKAHKTPEFSNREVFEGNAEQRANEYQQFSQIQKNESYLVFRLHLLLQVKKQRLWAKEIS